LYLGAGALGSTISVPAFERGAKTNPNARTANAITLNFFHMIVIPPVLSRIELPLTTKVATKSAALRRQSLRELGTYRGLFVKPRIV
jgi:hypothetical protein